VFDQDYGDLGSAITVEVSELSPDGVLHVSLGGEFDRDVAAPLVTAISTAIQRDVPKAVRIDASALTFLDSGGIHALLNCQDAAVRAGASFSIDHAGPNVHRVLELTGLLALLNVTQDAPGASEAR
jgi:anti-anti-sigma factor